MGRPTYNLGHTFSWKPVWGHERRQLCSLPAFSCLDIKSIPPPPLESPSSRFQHRLKTSWDIQTPGQSRVLGPSINRWPLLDELNHSLWVILINSLHIYIFYKFYHSREPWLIQTAPKAMILNLWVMTPSGVVYQISCISVSIVFGWVTQSRGL